MGFPNIIGAAFNSVRGLIDDIHTSEEEKLEKREKLAIIEAGAVATAYDYEKTIAGAKRDIIVAEASSKHWLAANIRPAMMLMFGYIIFHNFVVVQVGNWILAMISPELPPIPPVENVELPDGVWSTIQLGMGGYIGARTVEKIAPGAINALTGRNKGNGRDNRE